jgi:hypothetical protein
LNYLFIAYSTAHFSHDSVEDKLALHNIAETAARAAKVTGYWVAVSCMCDPAEVESDVSTSLSSAINCILAHSMSRSIVFRMCSAALRE